MFPRFCCPRITVCCWSHSKPCCTLDIALKERYTKLSTHQIWAIWDLYYHITRIKPLFFKCWRRNNFCVFWGVFSISRSRMNIKGGITIENKSNSSELRKLLFNVTNFSCFIKWYKETSIRLNYPAVRFILNFVGAKPLFVLSSCFDIQ